MMEKYTTVDQYLWQQALSTKKILENLRILIKKICPEAIESIAYGMPAYKLKNKPLIYFAWYKKHIWIYATPTTHKAFEKELLWYIQGKWSVQFPLNKEIPFDVITKMINYKKEEILNNTL